MQDTERPDIRVAVRTLVRAGFILISSERNPGYVLLHMSRFDEFGVEIKYSFAIAEAKLDKRSIDAAQTSSIYHKTQLVIISENESIHPTFDWDSFMNMFGGSIYSINALEPDFKIQLIELGYNNTPQGLYGNADDLLEEYVKASFEFVFAVRVIKYGQKRKFEALPDGIIFLHQNFSVLYDAKAYKDGYKVTKNTIRQFASYVNDFNKRYKAYLPPIRYFIAVSGNFPHKPTTLQNRSHELFAECGAQLTFLNCENLARIIEMLAKHPKVRKAISWSDIFSKVIIIDSQIDEEIKRIQRDKVMSGA